MALSSLKVELCWLSNGVGMPPDRLIVEPNLETTKSVVAGITENNCSEGELRLNPVTVKGLDIKKAKTQLLQQRTSNRKRTARPRLDSGMSLPGKGMGPTAKNNESIKPATRARSLNVAVHDQIIKLRMLLSLAIFLGGT